MDIQPPVPQTQIPTQPSQPVPPTQKKRFPFVWILVVLLAGIAIGLFIPRLPPSPTPTSVPTPTPTPNPMAGWKTYTNKQYGFSVKYPADYIVSNENPSGESVYFVPAGYSVMSEQEKYEAATINVNVIVSDTTITPSAFVSSAKAPGYSNKRDITTLTIAERPAIRFMFSNTQAGNGRDEITTVISSRVNQNTLFLVTTTTLGNTDPYIFPTQILSTFKFIDQLTPTPACRPRPACLDATPRCMMPETSDMCPYSCPASGYVDCMPGPGKDMNRCSPDAMWWYKANCPNFKGGAM